MASHSMGLSLHQAARSMGVPFVEENEPKDRTVRANGLDVHLLEWGDPAKPALFMLHGVSQQAHSWDFVSLALSPDYHVFAMDQRGHGDTSWAADGDYSIDAMQADIDGVIDALGLDDFNLMGHSMGGRNSFIWASNHPNTLRSLTIVDTGPVTQRRGQDRIRQFRELPNNLDSFEEFAERVKEYTGRTEEQVLGALKYSIRQTPDGKWAWKWDPETRNRNRGSDPVWSPERLWECVAAVDCPSLVVRGSRSDIFAEETLAKMGEVMTDCTTQTIDNAGHLVQGDNPVDFIAAARELLSRTNG
ncbi:MAG: alpha/beta hydrolase [Chloroflexi bacterium]|nr:alpha/beta hydrolase [Chloroflexota bacterium]MDA1270839.1 alpha/beta hydrolase [Chloroflexota bacterium]